MHSEAPPSLLLKSDARLSNGDLFAALSTSLQESNKEAPLLLTMVRDRTIGSSSAKTEFVGLGLAQMLTAYLKKEEEGGFVAAVSILGSLFSHAHVDCGANDPRRECIAGLLDCLNSPSVIASEHKLSTVLKAIKTLSRNTQVKDEALSLHCSMLAVMPTISGNAQKLTSALESLLYVLSNFCHLDPAMQESTAQAASGLLLSALASEDVHVCGF